ncbi:NrsF family protein [Halioxenophilus aromaticivorans]|uniref:DUF1109 domain-containing protein n=1 Tax=Halioxenophilus aromaticivorans TaxID=1306992 RepID=A0AAV3U9N8_9ALTE
MNNQTLIQSLSNNLQPVKPTLSPNLIALIWLSAAVAALAIAANFLWPVRGDLWQLITHNVRFTIELINVVAAIVMLTLAAFRSAVPGENSATPARWGGLLTLTWLAQYAVGIWLPTAEDRTPPSEFMCWVFIISYALLFFIPAMITCLRLYPLAPKRTGFYCSLAAGLIPTAYMHIACAYSISHIFSAHILPLAVLALAATAVFAVLYRRKQRKKIDR